MYWMVEMTPAMKTRVNAARASRGEWFDPMGDSFGEWLEELGFE
jgi:hypothetical protein